MLQFSAFLIPLIFIIVWFDYRRCAKMGIDAYKPERNITNISIGITEQITALVSMAAVYFWIEWLYEFAFFQLSNTWYNWAILFFLSDFCFYWSHRTSHKTNFLWANHITHHQSEDYNLLVGFRLGSFQFLARFIFWIPMPLLGFKIEWIATTLILSGLYEWLLHTRSIREWGVLEYILMSPSSHRVHHGKNDQYIDKNYGSTFSIWDRMFRTFADETEEVQFGIKSPWRDDNPYMSSFQHYVDTWKTARTFKRPLDKLLIWIKPPGWLPSDGAYRYQYGSNTSKPLIPLCPALSFYVHTQMTISLVYFIVYYLYHQSISPPALWFSGLWILISVLNCGYLVSRKTTSRTVEIIRMGILFIISLVCILDHPLLFFVGAVHSLISIFWIQRLNKREVFGFQ